VRQPLWELPRFPTASFHRAQQRGRGGDAVALPRTVLPSTGLDLPTYLALLLPHRQPLHISPVSWTFSAAAILPWEPSAYTALTSTLGNNDARLRDCLDAGCSRHRQRPGGVAHAQRARGSAAEPPCCSSIVALALHSCGPTASTVRGCDFRVEAPARRGLSWGKLDRTNTRGIKECAEERTACAAPAGIRGRNAASRARGAWRQVARGGTQ